MTILHKHTGAEKTPYNEQETLRELARISLMSFNELTYFMLKVTYGGIELTAETMFLVQKLIKHYPLTAMIVSGAMLSTNIDPANSAIAATAVLSAGYLLNQTELPENLKDYGNFIQQEIARDDFFDIEERYKLANQLIDSDIDYLFD